MLYNAGGGEKASYDLSGSTLVSVSADPNGAALLLENGQLCTAVVLDKNLGVQYSSGVPTANRIVRDGSTFYLLTDSTVECFSSRDGYQWSLPLDARPQALLASGKRLLVFSGNTVQALSAPDAAASGAQ